MNILSEYKVLLCCAAAVALTSCDDFLDTLPDERVEITTEDQVVKLLTTAYTNGNYGWLCELSSDNVIDIQSPYYATQSNGDQIRVYYNLTAYGREDDEAFRFEPVRSSTSTDSPSMIWEGCYGAIATANHALEVIERMRQAGGGTMSPNLSAAYAEALLSRAFHHFILVNVFSQAWKSDEASKADRGVPYVTEPEVDLVKEYSRSTVADTYAKIEADLEEGLKYVSNINYQMPKWHFNVSAAHAFAARFYLYKRNYEKVIEHADAVLGTDPAVLPSLLMDYSGFDDCTRSTDYAEIWQGPNEPNNLMLISTNSVQWRRSIGYRYACAGPAIRDIIMHLGPNWRWYTMPAAGVGGGTFWDGNQDHGFTSSRIAERFEYSDKVAGIGYPHVIRREFTATELLLERAEAYLLGRKDLAACEADLIAYEESRQSFSEKEKAFYTSGGALTPLTHDVLLRYYRQTTNSNVLPDWDFMQNMDPELVVTDEMLPYMNCINDMRRYEVAYSGHRFFDLKRWAMPWSHTYGNAESSTTVTLEWDDPRRAIEVPQEVLAAGMESSRQPALEGDNTKSKATGRYTGTPSLKK